MEMADVHHIAIYDDLIVAKVQGCTRAYDARVWPQAATLKS